MITLKIRVVFITLAILCLTIEHCNCYASPQDSTILSAKELNKLARTAYMQGDFDKSKQYFLQSIAVDPDLAPTFNNIGILLKAQGKLDEALYYYNEAEKILSRDQESNLSKIAQVYVNKGIIFKEKGDYFQALKYYNNALNMLYQANDKKNQESIGKAYINLGIIYIKQGNDSAALDVFLKSVEIKKQEKPEDLPVAYTNIASAYRNLGLLDLAEEYYRKSIDIRIKSYDSTYHKLSGTYINLGIIEMDRGNYQKALSLFDKAHWIVNANFGENSHSHSPIWLAKGNMYSEMKNYTTALECYHKATYFLVEGFDEKDKFKDPEIEMLNADAQLVDILSRKASSAYNVYMMEDNDRKYLDESLNLNELLILLIEKIRSGYLDDESKMLMIQETRDILNQALNVAYKAFEHNNDMGVFNKAFSFAEKSKAALLSSAISDEENKKSYGIPVNTQNFEKDILVETDFYEKKIYEEEHEKSPDLSKITIWQSKLLDLSQKYDSLLHVLMERYPVYYRLKYDKKVAGVRDVQRMLKRNSALIEYSITDSLLYTFIISKNDFELYRNPIDSTFFNNINDIVEIIRDDQFGNISYEDFENYIKCSNYLYELLIGQSKILKKGMRLHIIPDNQLGYLPFEVLLTSIPQDVAFEFKSLPYMLYDHSVNYSYSATMLIQQEERGNVNDIKTIAFAPAYNNVENIDTSKFLASRDYRDALVPLRFAIDELNGIKEIVNSDLYFNDDASEANFWKLASGYDIIHFAMHTLINNDNPMYSQLVFTLTNDTLENNDGLLNTYEIYNADLNAQLAILSACNTGFGKLHKGEGVMSLARGFFYAGVPSVVMTLWAVLDRSGAQLMKNFYFYLEKGEDIDIALQKAKIQYLQGSDEITSHPYLWSAYVSLGDPAAIYPGKKGINIYILIIGATILVFTIAFLVYRKKKSRS
ncbi:CHAT domain-containing protein [Bacteroidota bacterium]